MFFRESSSAAHPDCGSVLRRSRIACSASSGTPRPRSNPETACSSHALLNGHCHRCDVPCTARSGDDSVRVRIITIKIKVHCVFGNRIVPGTRRKFDGRLDSNESGCPIMPQRKRGMREQKADRSMLLRGQPACSSPKIRKTSSPLYSN